MTSGDYVVVIRAVGFDSLASKLRVEANSVLDSSFVMKRTAQPLATVAVTAPTNPYAMRLTEFEERRAMGFGKFLDYSIFEKNSASQVASLITGRVPGLRLRRVAGKVVLAAARDARTCYPQVVVNGIVRFNGALREVERRDAETMMFDLASLRTDELIGFEWYTPASTPLQYRATGAGGDGSFCGTAIFWTK